MMKLAAVAMTLMMAGALGCAGETGQSAEDVKDTDSTTSSTSELSVSPMSAGDCIHGANGFVDISDSLSGVVRRQVDVFGSTHITLETATINGRTRGFAKLSGVTVPGDSVWMDWTVTNFRSGWLQCGPFVVQVQNRSYTSAAKETNPSPDWRFRACAQLVPDNRVVCTDPW
ncbi:MAG TPA: hypothetical protein VNO21_10870 [Polyangiaceae bacterium]|nr:hypothetical protein [Polyangiaceae bacterium]